MASASRQKNGWASRERAAYGVRRALYDVVGGSDGWPISGSAFAQDKHRMNGRGTASRAARFRVGHWSPNLMRNKQMKRILVAAAAIVMAGTAYAQTATTSTTTST